MHYQLCLFMHKALGPGPWPHQLATVKPSGKEILGQPLFLDAPRVSSYWMFGAVW